MEPILLGKSDIKISPVLMGTWQAGRENWSGIEDVESIRAIRAAYEHGITAFDSAEAYGKGHSERIVGKALEGMREKVVIATKVFPTHFRYEKVINSCHQSLKNLNTDYIDLYQLHWPSGIHGTKKVPIEETMEAMAKLKGQGKIRSIGVSNFSSRQIEEAERYGVIDTLQPPYSLFWRHLEQVEMPYCIKKGITILAYSPMAQGILTGKFGNRPSFNKDDHRSRNRLFNPEHYGRILNALKNLQEIADIYEITLGQLALAWVISHEGFCAIAGARNETQVRQNARAMEILLTEEDLMQMDKIGRTVTENLDDNPVLWTF